ncbi:MAG: hypothetical protein EXQ91_02495 [Alphaproteobacteria bacterium]|nr:hypothetical protein [Alphaproteobacteria bacterium]
MNPNPLRHVTDAEVEQFDRDGVIIVRNVFDREWIEYMRAAVDEVLANPGEYTIDIDKGKKPGRYIFDTWLWPVNDKFRQIVFDSPAGAVGAELMRARQVTLVFDFISVKEPNTPKPTLWHQDGPGNPVEGPQSISAWIALDRVTAASGAMRMIRGSHRWGRRFEPKGSGDAAVNPNYAGRDKKGARPVGLEDMPNIDAELTKYDIVQLPCEAGDVVFFDMLTCHSSPGNMTDSRRRAIGLRLAGEKATYAVRNTFLSIHPHIEVGLTDGQNFPPQRSHHIFPLIWPRTAA